MLWSNWGQRIQLFAFLVLGITFAILHHLLGTYLSGKPVFQRAGIPFDQPRLSSTSNAISHVIQFLFATTIGIAFAQYFWIATEKYQSDEHWTKLDAPLAGAKGNPFTISAFPMWYRSPGLAISSLMISSTVLIPIFVPGSIRVVAGGRTQPCTVNSPNISIPGLLQAVGSVGGTYPNGQPINATILPSLRVSGIVNSIIFGGSYMRIPSPCGICSYHLNFSGVSMNCSSDIAYNFSVNLPMAYKGAITHTPLWNAFPNSSTSEGYYLSVATRDMTIVNDRPRSLDRHVVAVKCYAYRADYGIHVQHDNFSSHIDVLSVKPRNRLSPTLQFDINGNLSNGTGSNLVDGGFNALVEAVVIALEGTIAYDTLMKKFFDTQLNIAYTVVDWTYYPNGTTLLTLSDPATFISSLMQNVSLSLLSGQFLSNNETYMVKEPNECLVTQLIYEYDSQRLLAIYGAGAAVAAIFFSLGFIFISKNEVEHNLDFSHVVKQLPFSPHI